MRKEKRSFIPLQKQLNKKFAESHKISYSQNRDKHLGNRNDSQPTYHDSYGRIDHRY